MHDHFWGMTQAARPADTIDQLHALRERLTALIDRARYYDDYPRTKEEFAAQAEETKQSIADAIRTAERSSR